MLRWLTAGESHGPALVAMIEGLPAGVEVGAKDLQAALSRRRLGYGRGARMTFEQDEVEFLGGLRHGLTLGSPVAVRIGNSEWPKWTTVMSPEAVSDQAYAASDDVNAEKEVARNKPLTRPRPGHADLVGMQKYGHEDARPVLERASARETAARVALGEIAARFLEQAYGIRLVSHTVSIGTAVAEAAAGEGGLQVLRADLDPRGETLDHGDECGPVRLTGRQPTQHGSILPCVRGADRTRPLRGTVHVVAQRAAAQTRGRTCTTRATSRPTSIQGPKAMSSLRVPRRSTSRAMP